MERLRRDRVISVTALADALQVSTETIRRDLRTLAAKGILVKQHGNVLWPEPRRRAAATPHGRRHGRQEAHRRGDRARDQGRRILLIDSGPPRSMSPKGCAGIATSPPSRLRAGGADAGAGDGNRVFLAGGEVRADDSAVYGPACLAYLGQPAAETAILSAAAISASSA